jgi:hypothetical protein
MDNTTVRRGFAVVTGSNPFASYNLNSPKNDITVWKSAEGKSK